ncbi:unnamed protein product [Spirodela intermedia]|uniref:Cobalamin-independent methionine synthase MetE N-terminal domain-containing protein n=1 Tax=Spirodela intermedia TaxID=51605 RepID=A0A7I8KF76_SPIIN|nr:unnamed protein product [Spirodela intermedia]
MVFGCSPLLSSKRSSPSSSFASSLLDRWKGCRPTPLLRAKPHLATEDLQKVDADLRSSIWKQMSDAGIKCIPSNTFSFYDQVLYTTAMLGAAPDRYGYTSGKIGHDIYFFHG